MQRKEISMVNLMRDVLTSLTLRAASPFNALSGRCVVAPVLGRLRSAATRPPCARLLLKLASYKSLSNRS